MHHPSPPGLGALRARAARLAAAAALPLSLLVTGCGAAAQRPQVASLAPSGHARPTTTTPSTAANEGIPDPGGRPRQTLDMTSQQIRIMFTPFDNCLQRHGGKNAMLTAVQTCTEYQPLPPWQLDPANPQSRAYVGRVVTCLRGEGYNARAGFTTEQDIGARQWIVYYTPSIVGIQLRTENAQDSCQEQALR